MDNSLLPLDFSNLPKEVTEDYAAERYVHYDELIQKTAPGIMRNSWMAYQEYWQQVYLGLTSNGDNPNLPIIQINK